MDYTQILGLAAATLTTISGLPQLIKILKLKETRDLSLEMYLLMFTGITLWFIYGIIKKDLPLIIGNIITLFITGIIIGLKLKYK
jgi:MtN3 and saliva related transmembrane protein